MQLPKSLYTVAVFTKISSRRFFRDRLSIFFGVLFPLIFLFVFGGIFGKSSGTSFHLALINESKSPVATQFVNSLKDQKSLKIDVNQYSLDDASQKMVRSQLDAAVVLPKDFGSVVDGQQLPSGQAKVYYTQNNAQAGQTLSAILGGVFQGMNRQMTGAAEPFTVKGEQLNKNSLTQFDYTFAGLLGFSLLGIGIFGPINVFPELKKQGILRRLSTTPLRVWQYFTSTAISQCFIGLISIGVMFAVAATVFDLKVVGNVFVLAAFIVFGIVQILGIGLAIGGWAKNERQAAPLSNIIVFPMMFLSGTFFPRFLMPQFLQTVSNYLPLTPVIDGIRYIVNEGYGLSQLGPQLLLMAGWTIVVYFIAFRLFRWE